jgi:hypothetical protein
MEKFTHLAGSVLFAAKTHVVHDIGHFTLVQYILVLVTIVFAIIELVLVHTIARCATDTALSFFKTDQTDEMHEVVQDLCLEVEASQLRTTLLDLDVGERTVESGTQSLFQLATAAEEELDNLGTKIDLVEHELGAAVKTTAEDTHKVIPVQLGGQL